ncbi:MAG: hypothetical protein RMK80_02800 [Pseudobdellovibrionaceae bacterium]|nr:hypothetical protein [Pseudobdellovibrionaceae bacterium]
MKIVSRILSVGVVPLMITFTPFLIKANDTSLKDSESISDFCELIKYEWSQSVVKPDPNRASFGGKASGEQHEFHDGALNMAWKLIALLFSVVFTESTIKDVANLSYRARFDLLYNHIWLWTVDQLNHAQKHTGKLSLAEKRRFIREAIEGIKKLYPDLVLTSSYDPKDFHKLTRMMWISTQLNRKHGPKTFYNSFRERFVEQFLSKYYVGKNHRMQSYLRAVGRRFPKLGLSLLLLASSIYLVYQHLQIDGTQELGSLEKEFEELIRMGCLIE